MRAGGAYAFAAYAKHASPFPRVAPQSLASRSLSPPAVPMSDPAHSPRLFPLFADLRDRTVVVVGGGAVAARKVEALLGTGARIVVGAPALRSEEHTSELQSRENI